MSRENESYSEVFFFLSTNYLHNMFSERMLKSSHMQGMASEAIQQKDRHFPLASL
jgi:hypothetical protein